MVNLLTVLIHALLVPANLCLLAQWDQVHLGHIDLKTRTMILQSKMEQVNVQSQSGTWWHCCRQLMNCHITRYYHPGKGQGCRQRGWLTYSLQKPAVPNTTNNDWAEGYRLT